MRYRLALTVEADGAEHSGSGVIQVTYGKNMMIGAAAEIYVEAVTVDIPGRGTLFAVLKAAQDHRSNPGWAVLEAFGFPRKVSFVGKPGPGARAHGPSGACAGRPAVAGALS